MVIRAPTTKDSLAYNLGLIFQSFTSGTWSMIVASAFFVGLVYSSLDKKGQERVETEVKKKQERLRQIFFADGATYNASLERKKSCVLSNECALWIHPFLSCPNALCRYSFWSLRMFIMNSYSAMLEMMGGAVFEEKGRTPPQKIIALGWAFFIVVVLAA